MRRAGGASEGLETRASVSPARRARPRRRVLRCPNWAAAAALAASALLPSQLAPQPLVVQHEAVVR